MTQLSTPVMTKRQMRAQVGKSPIYKKMGAKYQGKILARNIIRERKSDLRYLKGLSEQDWKRAESTSNEVMREAYKELRKYVKHL